METGEAERISQKQISLVSLVSVIGRMREGGNFIAAPFCIDLLMEGPGVVSMTANPQSVGNSPHGPGRITSFTGIVRPVSINRHE
jgi:hypothetical protein